MKISDILIRWYLKHKRQLPWRRTKDPYFIWISEIILQQTRVSQGLDYYLKFIKNFPDVNSLAEAETDDVLKLWQGLGYYSRARNMHVAAKEIVSIYKGKFPKTSVELEKLKGIGKYTSAAIASICFNEKTPVVDGNVVRWLSRMNAIEIPVESDKMRKVVFHIAEELMENHNPGEFNQAMMEFGALFCIPLNPDCLNCPFKKSCVAYIKNEVALFPKKTIRKIQKIRNFNYLLITDNSGLLLSKRQTNDIWKGLYEFPLIESDRSITLKGLVKSDAFEVYTRNKKISIKKMGGTLRHILSHQIIVAKFYKIVVKNLSEIRSEKDEVVLISKLKEYPVSRLIEKFIEEELKF